MKARWIAVIVIVVVLLVSITLVWPALSSMFLSTDASFEPYNPYESGGTWYKGGLHSHSTRSDGKLSPSEVVARYASLGFDFIAITDHHTVTKIKGNGLLVLGQESGKGSTESGEEYHPHMNGIAISTAPSESLSQQQRIDSITAQGGIVVLNHPTVFFYAYDLNDLRDLKNYTGMEIYSGYSDGVLKGNPVSLWDDILSTGKRVWGVAADDAHELDDYGKGWIEVRLTGALNTANVINAIKKGSFYSSQGPTISDLSFNGTTFSVSTPNADSVNFYGRNGKLLKSVSEGNASYTVDGSEGYVRAEVSKDGLKARSQPVFIGSTPTSSTMQIAHINHLAVRSDWFIAQWSDLSPPMVDAE
jgi:hypothetical protein